MTIKTTEETNFVLDYVTRNILECVEFWNNKGEEIYNKNVDGLLGSNETNRMARAMVPVDFLLEMILIDCQTFCDSDHHVAVDYFAGRNKSHVWVHQHNERVLMIHI